MDYGDIEDYLRLTSGPSVVDHYYGAYQEPEIFRMPVRQKQMNELTDGLSSNEDSVETFLRKFSIGDKEPNVKEISKKKKKKKKFEVLEPEEKNMEIIEPDFSGGDPAEFRHVNELVKKFKERKKNR
jgi:hypothetical protein